MGEKFLITFQPGANLNAEAKHVSRPGGINATDNTLTENQAKLNSTVRILLKADDLRDYFITPGNSLGEKLLRAYDKVNSRFCINRKKS